MIIHQPEMLKRDGNSIVHARIEMRQPRGNFPEHMWFKVPERYSAQLSMQSDAFLIASLAAGMHYQEDIEVRGTVSPKLAYHLGEVQHLLHFRSPKIVTAVEIKYGQLKPLQANPQAVGAAFSGGVDSFFTLWKHLPKNQAIPDFRITHALFMLGFDILNKDKARYQTLYSRYQDVLHKINIELVPLETNLVSMTIPISRRYFFYEQILIGAAHIFGNLFQKFFIPSTKDYWYLKSKISSSELTSDPLLSTDTLEIFHHGSAIRRAEKIEAICDWEPVQAHLRVCSPNKPDTHTLNCGRCEKCFRTMIPIYALGKMEKFTTFQKPIRSNHEMLWWARKFDPAKGFVKEMFPYIRRIRPGLIPWLRLAALAGYVRYWILRLIPKPSRRWLQRFGFFVDPLAQVNAFDDIETMCIIKSVNSNECEVK
jgi:hypothetical protein